MPNLCVYYKYKKEQENLCKSFHKYWKLNKMITTPTIFLSCIGFQKMEIVSYKKCMRYGGWGNYTSDAVKEVIPSTVVVKEKSSGSA